MAENKWPPALKEFIKRTFATCTVHTRPAVEAELKELIKTHHDQGTLFTVNWDAVQLKAFGGGMNGKRKNPLTFTPAKTVDDEQRLAKRQRRFESGTATPTMTNGVRDLSIASDSSAVDEEYIKNIPGYDKHTLIGRSQKLEKPYLRLTSYPNPDEIRPLDVCKRALDHIKKKWRSEGNYNWVCDQFKSLRQDLTVQRIKNDLTVQVYEIHARIALEKGDLGEFNTCEAQLRPLYRQGLKGHQLEFLGYRILYLLFTRNRADLNSLLPTITPAQRRDQSVAHALSVRFAMSHSLYRRFFQLFVVAPKMGGYLMDQFTTRERVKALSIMAKAYMQVPFAFLQQELAFDTDEECRKFLELQKALHYKDGSEAVWDPKPAKDLLLRAATARGKVDLGGQI